MSFLGKTNPILSKVWKRSSKFNC